MVRIPNIPPEVQALQWYPLNVAHEVDLLRNYVQDVEEQVDRGIEGFRNGKVAREVEDRFGGDPQFVTSYRDLEDDMWDLGTVFEDYFPNLQRGSAAVTLFAFLENELNNLCHLLHKIDGTKVSLKDLYGDGVERASNYLELVAGVDPQKNTPSWQEIKGIQLFRNSWVHAVGRLPKKTPGEKTKLAQYIEKTPLLELAGRDIKIKQGYIGHMLGTFDEYFQMLHQGVKAKYQRQVP